MYLRSEIKFQCKLNDPWRSRLRDLSEVAVKSEVVRVKELSVIEGVEELGTKFDTLALGQFESTANSQVEVVPSRTAQDIPARVPEGEHRVVAAEGCGIKIELGIDHGSWHAIGARGIKAVQ